MAALLSTEDDGSLISRVLTLIGQRKTRFDLDFNVVQGAIVVLTGATGFLG